MEDVCYEFKEALSMRTGGKRITATQQVALEDSARLVFTRCGAKLIEERVDRVRDQYFFDGPSVDEWLAEYADAVLTCMLCYGWKLSARIRAFTDTSFAAVFSLGDYLAHECTPSATQLVNMCWYIAFVNEAVVELEAVSGGEQHTALTHKLGLHCRAVRRIANTLLGIHGGSPEDIVMACDCGATVLVWSGARNSRASLTGILEGLLTQYSSTDAIMDTDIAQKRIRTDFEPAEARVLSQHTLMTSPTACITDTAVAALAQCCDDDHGAPVLLEAYTRLIVEVTGKGASTGSTRADMHREAKELLGLCGRAVWDIGMYVTDIRRARDSAGPLAVLALAMLCARHSDTPAVFVREAIKLAGRKLRVSVDSSRNTESSVQWAAIIAALCNPQQAYQFSGAARREDSPDETTLEALSHVSAMLLFEADTDTALMRARHYVCALYLESRFYMDLWREDTERLLCSM